MVIILFNELDDLLGVVDRVVVVPLLVVDSAGRRSMLCVVVNLHLMFRHVCVCRF